MRERFLASLVFKHIVSTVISSTGIPGILHEAAETDHPHTALGGGELFVDQEGRPMTDAEKRMLKIKTGSVTRLKKELGLYVEEREKERQRVARMKEEGADSHDVKHAVRFFLLKIPAA